MNPSLDISLKLVVLLADRSSKEILLGGCMSISPRTLMLLVGRDLTPSTDARTSSSQLVPAIRWLQIIPTTKHKGGMAHAI